MHTAFHCRRGSRSWCSFRGSTLRLPLLLMMAQRMVWGFTMMPSYAMSLPVQRFSNLVVPSRILSSTRMDTYTPSRSCTGTCTVTRTHKSFRYVTTSGLYSSDVTTPKAEDGAKQVPIRSVSIGDNIILWRGEGTKGYSLQFRQLEFTNAYMASFQHIRRTGISTDPDPSSQGGDPNTIAYTDAIPPVDESDDLYGAMQYIHVNSEDTDAKLCKTSIIEATRRCSLVRDVYEIIAIGRSYQELAKNILTLLQKHDGDWNNSNSTLSTLTSDDGVNTTWSMRLRHYDSSKDDANATRYGTSKRSSMRREREALGAMKELFKKFRGPVRLKDPDCALYVLEGLHGLPMKATNATDGYSKEVDECHNPYNRMVFVQKITPQRKIQPSIISPNSRICVTRTPLCPIASILLCNLGRMQTCHRILDPYAGSASTLLAAAMIIPDVQSVGIDLADEDRVNRTHIVEDFMSRGLNPPVKLIRGDCTDDDVREEAILAVGGEAFDAIVADPPYGIRESMGMNTTKGEEEEGDDYEPSPLVQLVQCIKRDRERGLPLLKKGGRLVAFVPVSNIISELTTHEDGVGQGSASSSLQDNIPSIVQLHEAGLKVISMTEQPLSLTLSRWLVVYECIS